MVQTHLQRVINKNVGWCFGAARERLYMPSLYARTASEHLPDLCWARRGSSAIIRNFKRRHDKRFLSLKHQRSCGSHPLSPHLKKSSCAERLLLFSFTFLFKSAVLLISSKTMCGYRLHVHSVPDILLCNLTYSKIKM